MKVRQAIIAGILALVSITAFTSALAQTFVPIRIDARSYPAISAKIYALDATGMPQSLGASDVAVTENGTQATATTSCEPSNAGRNLSLVVAVDVSASTSQGTPSSMDLMKNAARGVTQLLTSTSDEIGLLTFDAQANLLFGLSTDKVTYTSVVDNVRTSSGVNLTTGLLSQPMGGLTHLQNARNNRALVLMTDGAPSFDVAASLSIARTFGIRVYVICMKNSASDQLKRLADSSGGAWAENVTTIADATAWARGFVADAKNFPSCKVSWNSITSCSNERLVSMTVGSTVRSLNYTLPSNALAVLEASTLGLHFGQPSAGNNVSRSMTLVARNGDVVITAITISNTRFSLISGPSLPLTIRKDQSQTISVQYAAATTDGQYGEMSFTSTTCDLPTISLRGGSPFVGAEIKLVKPNGGESLVAGSDTLIQWTNVLPQDVVRLEYSTDGGTQWKPLAESANGLSYAWKPGPAVSDSYRIRVSRTVVDPDNIVELTGSDQPLYSAVFTQDGQKVLTGGHDGTVRLWNAFNGTQERLVGVHGNWVWALAVMPNTTNVASASFDGSVRIWNYATGERIATIPMDGEAYTVAFSPDGKRLFIGSRRSITVVTTATWSTETVKVVPTGPVYDIDMATNGSVIAVAEGTVATVRNANTLEVVTTLESAGRTGEIYAVALNTAATRVATGGTDFIVATFNASTGSQISTAPAVIAPILSLDFSPDDASVLSSGGDGTVKIYSATDLTLQSSLAGHEGQVFSASYSPNGKRVVSASIDFTARVWTLDGIGSISDASDQNFRVIGATATATAIDMGNVALGAGSDKVANAVTAVGTAPLKILSADFVGGDVSDFGLISTTLPDQITAGTPLQLDVSFVPTQLGPRSADIDVVTGTGTVRVRVTGNAVNPTFIAPIVVDYGRRVANQAIVDTIITLRVPSTATQPVTVVTSVLTGPQANQFSIQAGGGNFTLAPGQQKQIQVRFEPTDFGRFAAELVFDVQGGSPFRVRLYGEGTGDGRIATTSTILFPTDRCTDPTSTQTITVSNYGNTQLQVFSAGVEGANASEFTVTAPSAYPIAIDPKGAITLNVTFNPTQNGAKDAKVVISSSAVNAVNGRSVVPISARRDSVGFELSRPTVNFDNINEGQEAIERLLLINTGTVALRWPRTSIVAGQFRIESITPEVTQPGEQSDMTVRFLGGTAGTVYDETYTFVDSVCGTAEPLRMIATVKSYIGADLRISSVKATTGQEVDVPVYISNKVNFDRTNVTQLDARLLVNGTILTPSGNTPMGTFRADGMREIAVMIPIPTTDSLATTLRFRTSWGNDTSSVIHIDSLILTDTLEIRKHDGEVIITDICREGGARLIELTQQAAGIRVAPLPATGSTTAVVTTVEAGRTSLDLVDLTGRVVRSVADRVMQGGSWFIPLDLTTIPNGSYFLILTTPSQRIVERIEVVR